ncbi:MAG TPA: S9 family peptidase [Longimicrobiaceae bacterium]|nr:S9 family peptidase [Longimicrobiaceae bacterium]
MLLRSSRIRLRLAGAVVVAALAPAALHAQGLTPEQVTSLRTVSSTAMSPDGRLVAFTVTATRDSAEERGNAYTELYVVPAAGGEPRAVVSRPRSASLPRWSPDGSTLAFIARLEGNSHSQVYGVPAAGGEPRPLTTAAGTVESFRWSPDGRSIAYTAPRVDPPGMERRRDPANDVVVMSEQGSWTRLYVQPASGGEARAVTPEDRNVVEFEWAPDGRTFAVQATKALGADADLVFRDLYVVPAAGGEMRELAPTPSKVGGMAWSPDGRMLAYLGGISANDPIAQSVLVVPAAGGTPRNLTPAYEGSATWVGWLDNGSVAFVADEGTRTVLNRVPASGGRIARIVGGGEEIFGSVDFDARNRTFSAPVNTARHPGEVYVGTVGGRGLRRVTTLNPWLSGVALGRQETVEWTGPEELRIQGVVVYPVGYQQGRRYPLAILPHGGPEGVSLEGWVTTPLYPAQVLAGRGYVVLMPNYRGSGGRGVAFSKGDQRDLMGREFDDVLAGIDHLAAQGVVDPQRVGISGTSYGGYMSAWAATRHSDRFKVAIPFAGISHWMSFLYTTDIPAEMSVVHFDLWCSENVGICWDRSPIAHVARATTPTLVGHGLVDERVHPEQSLELYNALRLKGVPTELVLYPREPHGLRERAHQLDYMRRITEWMDRYLQPGR